MGRLEQTATNAQEDFFKAVSKLKTNAAAKANELVASGKEKLEDQAQAFGVDVTDQSVAVENQVKKVLARDKRIVERSSTTDRKIALMQRALNETKMTLNATASIVIFDPGGEISGQVFTPNFGRPFSAVSKLISANSTSKRVF